MLQLALCIDAFLEHFKQSENKLRQICLHHPNSLTEAMDDLFK